ncbi:MAG: DUF4105 domain-containing protein [Alphaproteobacteria bacterium]
MKKYFLLFVFSFFASNEANALAPTVEEYSETKEWLAIVHYQPKFFGGYQGTIESEHFYISKEGRDNPQAELEETIKMFKSGDVSRICYFPARFKLLQKNGFLDDVSYSHCEMYEEFYKELSPSGLTMLFTDAYMNNPSSLFGHTLFRIDSKNKGTDLLAHGVNYGAFVDENKENPIVYAFQGLTGGYEGGFTVKPYYDIINDYNNIENRDIWEYQLDLSDDELNIFVAHLWELGHSRAGYVFLSRNCSYLLMEVLDGVKPELQLASEFPGHTIPLDTVRAVAQKDGLIKSYVYRTSRQNKIKNQFTQLSEKQKDVFFDVVEEEEVSEVDYQDLDNSEKANVLETAYQYVQYEKSVDVIERDEYRKRSFSLLKAKNELVEKSHFEDLKTEENPLEAHKSQRAALGFGVRNGQAFQEIMYRPAYHSLTDNNYGYLKGAEINFLNGSIRHYDNQNKYVLNDLEFLGLKSLAPISSLFKHYSYNLKISLDRVMDPDNEKEGYVFSTKTGVGATYELWQNMYVFAFVNGYFSYGGIINQNQYAAIGPSAGAFYDLGRVRFLGEAESLFATSKFANRYRYNAEISLGLTTNLSIAANYLYYDNDGHDVDESKVSIKYHF